MADVKRVLPELKDDEQSLIQNLVQVMTEEQARQFAKAYRKKRKSPTLVLFTTLLGFIGLGGVNRFLVGQTKLGIVYFLTLGFYWIGTIIDIFLHKSIAFKYNEKQAQEIAKKLQVDIRDIEAQDTSLGEAQKRKEIFDTYNEMATQLLNQFQESMWGAKKSQSAQAVHFSDNPATSVPPEHAWKGWYIGKPDNNLLRYFYGVTIILEGEVGNLSPVFGVCYSENRVPKLIITKSMLKSELSKALELAKKTSPIDLSMVDEYGNGSNEKLLIPQLMDFAIAGEKLKYMQSALESVRKN